MLSIIRRSKVTTHIWGGFAVTILLLGSSTMACGAKTPPPMAVQPTVAATVLTPLGPATVYGDFFAARSITNLKAMVFAFGGNPSLADCSVAARNNLTWCWSNLTIPTSAQLLVAAVLLDSCRTFDGLSVSAPTTSQLLITIAHGSKNCPVQAALSAPHLSLIALSGSLPTTLSSVVATHTYPDGPSKSTHQVPVSMAVPTTATADLASLTSSITGHIHSIYESLVGSPAPTVITPAAIGEGTWQDSSLGCPVGGKAYLPGPFVGYVIRFATSPPSTLEYHASTGLPVVSCGSV